MVLGRRDSLKGTAWMGASIAGLLALFAAGAEVPSGRTGPLPEGSLLVRRTGSP